MFSKLALFGIIDKNRLSTTEELPVDEDNEEEFNMFLKTKKMYSMMVILLAAHQTCPTSTGLKITMPQDAQ